MREGRSAPAGGQGPPRDGYEVANAMGMEEETRLYPFFSALWKKIDSKVGFPPDFVKERLHGSITAQLVVDRRGVFTGRIAGVNSDQPVLEAYVLAVLFHALAEPLPREQWSDREQVILVSHFEFRTFTYGEVPPPHEQRELKNMLEFARYGYNDPKLNEVIHEFFTHSFPPIIPVPGGFYIDFPRAYELVRNLHQKKVEEGDLRLERINLERAQWEEFVRKQSAPSGTPPSVEN